MSERKEMQNWRDKHASVLFLERKWYPHIIQNPFPGNPNGVQNPVWRPPGRLVSAWNAALVLDYIYIYIYIERERERESRARFARVWFSWKINCSVLLRWWNCYEKTSVVLRRGGISWMEYHLFLDISRCRSITSKRRTQTPKAARNEQVEQESEWAKATSDRQWSGHSLLMFSNLGCPSETFFLGAFKCAASC